MTASELRIALAARRKAERLSYRAVGEQSGISFMTVRRIELGQAFDYETGIKLANWLQPPGEREGTIAVIRAAIWSDARLTGKQKIWMSEAFGEVYELLIEKNEVKK